MIELKKFLNKENFIIPVVTIYMFFWDMPQTLGINLDFRLVIFGLSFFLLIELIKDIKNKNFTFIYISILIASLLIAHSFIVGNLLNIKFYFSIIFLIFIFGIAYYFYDVILENKKAIIYLFLVLFLSSIIIHFFRDFATNPEPVSCGAIKNFFLGNANNFGTPIFLIHFVSSYSLIFNENSHLAMSGVGAIIYSIFIITKDKKLMSSDYKNKLIFIMLILFIFICFLKSSATLLAGMFFSILTLIIFEYKTLGRYFIICSIILTSAISFIFFQDEVCLNKITLSTSQKDQFVKINPFSDSNKIQIEIDSLEDQLIEINKKLNNRNISEEEGSKVIKLKLVIENELINKNEDLKKKKAENQKLEKKYVGSLSSDVFYHALQVTLKSLLSKPLGWGFQGYELAFNDYNKKNNYHRRELGIYNSMDASNTFFKIITEFGIFSFFLYSIILFIFISNKISIENKVFLVPFIVTQSIRGAGYFNGAFILILFLLIVIQFKKSRISNN